ncbi:fimbria/pilus outer membrane usher protein [Gluconacetobacter tumulisoli]|uniref:Fimbrial biogenesis outer membrane usher protein n=1 Tax=Gluconacetobacter tumulisoli TaxID=1286189 RepID=A0A7W4PJP6_9PROT|nr:fimbria/pilus outer membrane usher protein [Gluconacetobacter tumulisoli]MBB2200572.1 fimbrial biogenesis outer membrane usher protein [Gluconacetobacter tumulisoli]
MRVSGLRALAVALGLSPLGAPLPPPARASAPPPADGRLPAAPRATGAMPDASLYLELIVNQRDTGLLAPVLDRRGHFLVAPSLLRRAGLPVTAPAVAAAMAGRSPGDDVPVALDDVAGLRVAYDSAGQRLLLTVPAAWLPRQTIGGDRIMDRHHARSSMGALFNYDVYGSTTGTTGALSAWTEARAFGRFGALSSTGVAQMALGGAAGASFRRYDTTWRWSDEDRVMTIEGGDLVTRALPWSSAIRLGGAQVARDFAVRPDIVTYPLPRFSGQAAVPTAVDLFINGRQASRSQVDPGPFTLTDVPYINGAGEATVVTTDALGRPVQTSVPFYVASTLLRPGLSDYTVAAGAIRRRYGIADFDYGTPTLSGSYRRGILPVLTLEAHAEFAPQLALGGVGALVQAGARLGVFNAAVSESRRRDNGYRALGLSGAGPGANAGWTSLPAQGRQYDVGYQYTARRVNISVQRIWRTAGYTDLSADDASSYRLSRSSLQATASLSLGRFGTLAAGYFDIRSDSTERTRLMNVSHTIPLWGGASLYLSANRAFGATAGGYRGGSGGGAWSGTAQLVVPLAGLGTVGAGFGHDATGQDDEQASISRATPARGGLGWNAAYVHYNDRNRDGTMQASLTWRTRAAQLQGGIYGPVAQTTEWAEASGSVVLMDDDLFAANRVQDGFVVISTDGVPGVPVRYENQAMGRTDRSGHLLMPYATSYYPGKYEIDPLDLPANMQATTVAQRISVRNGSGYLLRFPLRRVVAATIRLVDAPGRPLPMGSVVHAAGATAYVGWDGIVYLDNMQARNRLSVDLPGGGHCTAGVTLDPASPRIAQIGPLPCVAGGTP